MRHWDTVLYTGYRQLWHLGVITMGLVGCPTLTMVTKQWKTDILCFKPLSASHHIFFLKFKQIKRISIELTKNNKFFHIFFFMYIHFDLYFPFQVNYFFNKKIFNRKIFISGWIINNNDNKYFFIFTFVQNIHDACWLTQNIYKICD